MKSNTIYLGPLACGVLLAGAMVASGHNGATGIIGERMMGMMMLSEQIKALAPVAEAPTSSDAETVIAAAEMIAMHAGPAMTELFPRAVSEPPRKPGRKSGSDGRNSPRMRTSLAYWARNLALRARYFLHPRRKRRKPRSRRRQSRSPRNGSGWTSPGSWAYRRTERSMSI